MIEVLSLEHINLTAGEITAILHFYTFTYLKLSRQACHSFQLYLKNNAVTTTLRKLLLQTVLFSIHFIKYTACETVADFMYWSFQVFKVQFT